MKSKTAPTGIALAIATALSLYAATSNAAPDAARLGADLTATGAEKAANKDGVIPAFAAAPVAEAGWSQGKKREDFFKFKGDKPLFAIDASNVDKYADKLSPGQVQLIKQTKGYRMDVYATRRTCSVPDFVQENSKKNIGTAKLGDDGWSLKEAVVPGVPFPMPENGAQAMWNYKMKYAGIGFEWPLNYVSLSPRKGSTDWIQAGATETYYFPWGK